MKTLPEVYSQRDPQWANQRLGTVDGTTIGQYGCYLTSFAMVSGFFGHQITPNALDDIFTNQKLYTNGNLCSDDMLTKVFSDISFVNSFLYFNNPADLGQLQTLMAQPNQLVILEVDFDHDPNDGIQTHFVVCVDCDGTNVKIADPWYGTVDDLTLHYGNNPSQTILKFVVYKGSPVEQTVAVPSNKFTELVDKSTKYDAFNSAGYVTIDDVSKKIGELQNDNTQAQNAINTLNDKITALASVVQKDAQEDLDLSAKNLDLEHQLSDIVKELGIPPSSTEKSILGAIQALKTPHEEVVKQVQPTLDKLAEAAFYQRIPKTESFINAVKNIVIKVWAFILGR